MNLKESQDKILKAVREARKLIEDIESTNANQDQVTLARGKLKEKASTDKKTLKAVKVIPKSKKGDEPPDGYIDPKPSDPTWRVLVNKDAIQNPEKFVSDKHKEEQKPK